LRWEGGDGEFEDIEELVAGKETCEVCWVVAEDFTQRKVEVPVGERNLEGWEGFGSARVEASGMRRRKECSVSIFDSAVFENWQVMWS
jgi:hypothetical protein